MLVPDHITRAQYVEALKAFNEVLGLETGEVFFPVVLGQDQIDLLLVVPNESGGKTLAHYAHGVGNPSSVVAAKIVIPVLNVEEAVA